MVSRIVQMVGNKTRVFISSKDAVFTQNVGEKKKGSENLKKSSHPWINFTEFFIYFWAATKSNISNFKNPNYICQIGEISLFINVLLAQIGNKVTHMNFGKYNILFLNSIEKQILVDLIPENYILHSKIWIVWIFFHSWKKPH